MKNNKVKYPELISVIPPDVMSNYIKYLENKNNFQNNTKYCIASEVYNIIDSGDFLNWNENLLKEKLKISDGALRFHKSIILKELRAIIFQTNDKNKEENIILKYKRFTEYFSEGIMEKYRNEFILFEKELILLTEKNKNTEFIAILSDVQRMLMISYFHKRNYIRFNFFIKKITNIRNNKVLPGKLSESNRILVEINYLWTLYYKKRYSWKNDNNFNEIEDINTKIYELAKKNKFVIHILSSLVAKVGLAIIDEKTLKIKTIAEKGIYESNKYNEQNVSNLFKVYLCYCELLTKKITAIQAFENIKILYEKSREYSQHSYAKIYILDIYVQTLFLIDESKVIQLLKEQIRIKTIIGHSYDALYSKFVFHNYNSLNGMIEYEALNEKTLQSEYLTIKSVNISLLSEAENNIKELLNCEKKIFDIKFLSDIYIVQGIIDLFKGKNIDLEKAILIQQRNDRLRRTRKFFSKDWYFNTLRIYFKILQLGNLKKEINKRDELLLLFIKQIEYFYIYPDDLGKLEYNILVYAS